MSQEYVFEFYGTKEELLNKLNIFPDNNYSDDRFYYFDNYIIKLVRDEIHFGVERTGHSGGQWFVPVITELEDHIELRGTIQYIGPKDFSTSTEAKESFLKRVASKIGEILFFVLVLPFVLVAYAVIKIRSFLKWIINKLRRRPYVKMETTEEKLFYLMENHLGCKRK